MTVRELTRDQLDALKQRMVDDEVYEAEGRGASWGELASAASEIGDEAVFERFAGTCFVPEDFL